MQGGHREGEGYGQVMQPEALVAIGRLTKPHGLRGELVLLSYVDDLAVLPSLMKRQVFLQGGAARPQPRLLVGWRVSGKRVLVRLDGCQDMTQAEAWRGYELFIPRAWFPSLAEGEYHWFEIEGLAVYASDGQHLGTITDMIATGSNDVYVVQNGTREIMVPALKEMIRGIDLGRGEMHLTVEEVFFDSIV